VTLLRAFGGVPLSDEIRVFAEGKPKGRVGFETQEGLNVVFGQGFDLPFTPVARRVDGCNRLAGG
jgi:hypothetical protein